MSGKLTVRQFFAEFPDDDACLKRVIEVRYGLRHICGHCGKKASFHKIAGRRELACALAAIVLRGLRRDTRGNVHLLHLEHKRRRGNDLGTGSAAVRWCAARNVRGR